MITDGQAPSGAYVACPTFPPYRYCWFRDGSFIADAMSRVGEVESAEAFFDWCAGVVEARGGRDLHARYALDGSEDASEWPKFQLDGFGLWLWALAEHCGRHGRRPGRWSRAVALTSEYLAERWREPCVDWWEEREGLHAATLGSIRAGLDAWDVASDVDLALAEDRVDGSALVLVLLGFGGSDVVSQVESELVSPGGGVHRHRDDTYYGGGEWLLLTAMLGLAYAQLGRSAEARDTLDWIAAHATPDGQLPEQSQDHLLAAENYEPWVRKWGPPPCPLLWSHAMFLTLAERVAPSR